VVDFPKEYEELFPRSFLEMIDISRSLGEMKIQLTQDVKPIDKKPYQLNLKYKEKVHKELEYQRLGSLSSGRSQTVLS